MLKRIDQALVLTVLLLGVAHTSLTPLFYRDFTVDALWFAGTGLAFVLLAILHLTRRSSESAFTHWAAFFGTLGLTGFTLLIVMKLSAPQAYASLVILSSLCITSWLSVQVITRSNRPAESLEEVRSRIDALDRKLVAHMAERGRQVIAAARFKDSSEAVRDPQRVEKVIAKVRALSSESAAHPDVVESTYRAMISAFIEMEMEERETIQHRTFEPSKKEVVV